MTIQKENRVRFIPVSIYGGIVIMPETDDNFYDLPRGGHVDDEELLKPPARELTEEKKTFFGGKTQV